jgi:hypothetical protein
VLHEQGICRLSLSTTEWEEIDDGAGVNGDYRIAGNGIQIDACVISFTPITAGKKLAFAIASGMRAVGGPIIDLLSPLMGGYERPVTP